MQANTLSGGFADPATQSAHAFRSVMEAMARPGTIQDIEGAAPPAPLSPAMGAVLLTLCDTETPVYLAGDMDCEAARAWLAFHTGAPFVGPAHCMFAVGKWDALAPLAVYPIGTSEYPDRSATLIVECSELAARCYIDGSRHQGSGNAFLARRGSVSGQPNPVPAGAGFHFHLWRTPRGFAPLNRSLALK